MKTKPMLLTALLAGATLLSACVVEPARPPAPAPRVEVMPPAPSPGYRWVKGHYRWEGNHWAWVPGHWVGAY
ncbi:YXWGXW repeat-containing protein [Paraburkholderia sp.]|uniref:YXWGXW repeat-containing protein n=1 Tax=Paraburkholderia sp. TaxID=1926495 RepID=UPI0025FC24B6|nr:YXWGXW repeat-containing protein [Paraburkholderia sp.]